MKERLDVILVEQGYAPSREKAKAILMSGIVYVNGQKEDKAGTFFDTEKISLEVRGSQPKYVSRGGIKLEKAMEQWQFSLEGMVCMDIGASTGGFTDCMLQNGAEKVYSVDVGTGQLAWKLRNDPRVVCMEQTNFRYMTAADIQEALDFASVDVSFISLRLIFPTAVKLLAPGAHLVALVKPQFEAGREQVGKKGLVKDPKVHLQVIESVAGYAAANGLQAAALDYSPITGSTGNIEFLMDLVYGPEETRLTREMTEAVVTAAHDKLEA